MRIEDNQDADFLRLKSIFKKIGWGIVVLFSLFLPFQFPILRGLKLPPRFLWLDEIFVMFAFVMFYFVLFSRGKINKSAAKIIFSMLILMSLGIISGLFNANSIIVTINGIFDYIKNFLVIPVFCAFAIEQGKARSIYRKLHRLALFLCMVAIAQEIMFVLGYPTDKLGVYFFDVRFGIMRTPSLMGHPNIFGLYVLLFFILDYANYKRIRWQNILFAIGIFLSVSRMVWISFVIGIFYLSIQGKSKKMLLLFALATIVVSLAIPSFYLHTTREMDPEKYFRGYTLMKSLEIWKDHPVLGIGPGMYGGVVSFVYNSPVYEHYNYSPRWYDYMVIIRSLDQFWTQVLAEVGMAGFMAFAVMLLILLMIARKESLNAARDSFRGKMHLGFSTVPIILALYLFGSGLNLTPFILTYGILFGSVLGMKDEGITR